MHKQNFSQTRNKQETNKENKQETNKKTNKQKIKKIIFLFVTDFYKILRSRRTCMLESIVNKNIL